MSSTSEDRHQHGHGHDHAHAGAHVHGAGATARALTIALCLILGFMAVEVAIGVISGSLALLSDAAHMLTDAAALGLSLFAARIATRPARGSMTYGFGRVEILSAQANGLTLVVLALVIVYEAITRLVNPPDVEGTLVLIVALLGIVVNLAATFTLSGASRESLNVEGSYKHILTDLFAFIATAVAGAIILATGFLRADAIASLLVAALMLHAGIGLVRASARVFLEAAPQGLDPQQIGMTLASHRGVVQVHDLHVWEVTSGFPALSAHVIVKAGCDCHELRHELARELGDKFGLSHTTLQVDHEHAPQGPIRIETAADADYVGAGSASPSASAHPEK